MRGKKNRRGRGGRKEDVKNITDQNHKTKK